MAEIRAMTTTEAGALLRRWQLNEWALERRVTKKALKEQRKIVEELLSRLTWHKAKKTEVDYVMAGLN